MTTILWNFQRVFDEICKYCSIKVSKAFKLEEIKVKVGIIVKDGKVNPTFELDKSIQDTHSEDEIKNIIGKVWIGEIVPLIELRLKGLYEVSCNAEKNKENPIITC